MRTTSLLLLATAVLACSPALARAGDEAPAASRPAAVLLLVATSPDGTVATFGQAGGDGGAAGTALARAVEALGFRLRSAAGQPVAVTGEGSGGGLLPVGDQAALEVARKAGAAAAFVVGVHVKADGGIRGTRLLGAAGRGQLRVLDVQSGAAVASAESDGAGFDAALERAAGAAARDIADRLVRAVEGPAAARWPVASPGPASGGVAVEVRGARGWSAVAAIIQKLGATEGVSAVHPREVRRGRIALAVDTRLPAAKVAAAIERARLPGGTARASARGDAQVQVEIRSEGAAPDATPSP